MAISKDNKRKVITTTTTSV